MEMITQKIESMKKHFQNISNGQGIYVHSFSTFFISGRQMLRRYIRPRMIQLLAPSNNNFELNIFWKKVIFFTLVILPYYYFSNEILLLFHLFLFKLHQKKLFRHFQNISQMVIALSKFSYIFKSRIFILVKQN